MLERELHRRRRAEVALFASEPPDDVPVAPDQVDRARVPRGDEDVAVGASETELTWK